MGRESCVDSPCRRFEHNRNLEKGHCFFGPKLSGACSVNYALGQICASMKTTEKKESKESTTELPPYVLITPARNEAAFIEKTLEAVVRETVLPVKWVIVNDGSTDVTGALVQGYAAKYDWIELVNLPVRKERNFAAKVYAFNAGRERVQNVAYE